MARGFGLEVEDVPEEYVPLEALVVLQALDRDGVATLLVRSTEGLAVWDRVGIAKCALDLFSTQCLDAFVPVSEDEDMAEDD